MTYSIWQGDSLTLIEGVEPPKCFNGELQEPDAMKIYEFEADSWEAATREFDKRYNAEDCCEVEEGS